jgi:hypothetical protein
MDGLLSQEEINALFSSNVDDDVDTTSHSDLLSPEERMLLVKYPILVWVPLLQHYPNW